MSNKKDKKEKDNDKSQAKRIQQEKRLQQQAKFKQQLRKIQQKQALLRSKSNPLIQYGLLQAYQFFMHQLAINGIPQSNVFEFAAQSVLKYQKKMKKKKQQLTKIQQYNKSIIQKVQSNKKVNISANKNKIIKPNMLPFKGEIEQVQLSILNKLKKNKQEKQVY